MGKKKTGKGKTAAKPTKAAPSGKRDAAGTPAATATASGSTKAGATPRQDSWPNEATPHVPPPKLPIDRAASTPVKADPPTGSSERRLFRRVPFFRKIQYKFETMDAFRSEFANDLSIGGMFIKTEKPEPLGSVIFLEFDLKDGSKILSGYGKVVRVNPSGVPDFDPGMGVEFMKFDAESMTRIKQLIAGRFDR